ncbi:hypothetical protein N7451_012032 [Penicillium sp. IBT 35674x]|nr:hypothetical protein N7451_012032 [Penicillium sp. IBT 35674x]
MVAQPRSGMTAKLHQAASSRAASTKGLMGQANIDQVTLNPQSLGSVVRQPVVVLGPYGRAHDFSRFGTVPFVVEDVGFFRALSYIGRLVEASRRRQSMVRKLEIIWQAGVFNYPQWLARWFQRMFQLDKEGFGVSIYCSHATSGVNSQRSFKVGNRVSYYEGSADVDKEVTKYVQNQCGDMAVAGGSIYPLPSLPPQSTSEC